MSVRPLLVLITLGATALLVPPEVAAGGGPPSAPAASVAQVGWRDPGLDVPVALRARHRRLVLRVGLDPAADGTLRVSADGPGGRRAVGRLRSRSGGVRTYVLRLPRRGEWVVEVDFSGHEGWGAAASSRRVTVR